MIIPRLDVVEVFNDEVQSDVRAFRAGVDDGDEDCVSVLLTHGGVLGDHLVQVAVKLIHSITPFFV